jgi:hypothetical protein
MSKIKIRRTSCINNWEIQIKGGMFGTDVSFDLDENEMKQFIDEFKFWEERVDDAIELKKVK